MALFAFAALAGAQTAQAAPSTALTKSGADATTGSATQTTHNGTVNWTVGYTNNSSGPASATVNDPIGADQTYVPGSFKAPPGWSKTYSTDGGSSFSPNDPGAATNYLRANNPNTTSPATGTLTAITPAFTPVKAGTGGDGFKPILFTATINGVATPEAWNIFHHGIAGDGKAKPSVVCTDLLTNGPCPSPTGAPQTFPQGTNSSVAGTAVGDLGSNNIPQYVLSGSRLYYAAVTNTTPAVIGVGCLDFQTQQSCGFVALQTESVNTPANGIGGLVQAPTGLIYGVSTTGEVLCFDPAAGTPCTGFPVNIGLPVNFGTTNRTAYGYLGTMHSINGQIYITDVDATQKASLSCFDPVNKTKCTGWATPKPLGSPQLVANIFTAFDAASKPIGVCSIVAWTSTAPPPGTVLCFTFAGSSLPAPPGLQTLVSTNVITNGFNVFMNPLPTTAPNGDLESFFPFWSVTAAPPFTRASATYCYDWTTQTRCTAFAANGVLNGPPNVSGGDPRPYGYASDGNGCLYSLGDAGYLFNFDAVTGASPCLITTTTAQLQPSAFYCDGQPGHVSGYGTFSLQHLDVNNVNLAGASYISVNDVNGNPVPGYQKVFLGNDGTVDLSGISPSGATSQISVILHLSLKNSNDFANGNTPSIQLTFSGQPPQFCFQTKATATCTVGSISNTANSSTTDATGTTNTTSNTVTMALTAQPDPVCPPPALPPTGHLMTTAVDSGLPPTLAGGLGVLALLGLALFAIRRRRQHF